MKPILHYDNNSNKPTSVEFQGKIYAVSNEINTIEEYAKKLNKEEKLELKYGTTIEELYAEWVYINSDS
jgi:hypothetical protein